MTMLPRRFATVLAGLALSLATLAIPYRFKVIVDEGFSGASTASDIGRAFQYLLMIVLVLAIATGLRFYFVSWLGERTVADLRRDRP